VSLMSVCCHTWIALVVIKLIVCDVDRLMFCAIGSGMCSPLTNVSPPRSFTMYERIRLLERAGWPSGHSGSSLPSGDHLSLSLLVSFR